jgi:hypothetical protein
MMLMLCSSRLGWYKRLCRELLSMSNLIVRILRLVEDGQPPVVQSDFTDAAGQTHTFVDKEPIFTEKDYPVRSLPQIGFVRCEVLERWKDSRGKDLVRITTSTPDCVESTDGLTEFVVTADSLSEGTWNATSLTVPLT